MQDSNNIDGKGSVTSVKSGEVRGDEDTKLRVRFERPLRRKSAPSLEEIEVMSSEEICQIFHDLHIHQIELELQNADLQRIQKETDAARARYLDLYDLAPLGYCAVSDKGLILEANLTAAILFGTTQGNLINKPISLMIITEDLDIFSLHFKQIFETGIQQAFELRMAKQDGTVFWGRLNLTVSHDVTGTPVFWFVFSDISEHKRALEALKENELRENEDRFRKLFKQHSAILLILDAETGQIIDANEAAVQFYGWTLEELKQKHIQEINTLPPEIVKAEMMKAFFSKKVRFEFRHRRADGSIRDVEVFSNTIESSGRELLFSIIHDITERKQAEEELREEERYLKTILKTSADGFLEVDLEGRITRTNEAYCRMTGYTSDELLKLNIADIDAFDSKDKVLARIQRIITNGAEIFETSHRRKDGSIFHIEISVMYVHAGGGKFVSFSRDITERKQAEEMLLRQTAELEATKIKVEDEKRLLAAVMEALPTGVAITDKNGGCVDSNSAFRRIWGGESLPKTQFIEDYASSQAWWDSTGRPVAREEWASAIAVKDGKSTIGQILRIKRFDDREAFIINSAAPVYDAEERVVGSAVAVQDITALLRMEKELLENKKDFACAQEVGSIGSWRLDIRQNVLAWSDENYRIFGIPKEMPLTYETFLSTIHPDDRSFVDAEWKAGLRGAPYDIEHRLVVDGQIKWVREKAYLEFDKNGELAGGFGITQDITERKLVEMALQKNREELQTILDSSPIMVFYKDCENRFIRVNKTLANAAGLPKAAMEGKLVREIFPHRTKDYWEDDKDVILSGKPKIGIIEPIETIFGPRWLQTDKIPHRDKDGTVIGIIGFSVDITERKEAEEQLQAMNRELEHRVEQRTRELQETQSHYLHAEKLAAIGKLSASIAHEFNNPLQGIMSVLKGLKKRAVMDDEDRDLLDAAIGESDRIKNLVRSLQDFNRPSTGKKMLVDIQKSIDSLLLLYKSDFKSKRISVVLNANERLPAIMAVPDQIKQVLLNLLNNATDACLQRSGTITIGTWLENDRVAVAISDTGVGIEPEKIDLIFQPFYTTKPSVKGTGLGLSICYGIIQNHQGEIRVESEPGQGSTFTVLLPYRENDVVSERIPQKRDS